MLESAQARSPLPCMFAPLFPAASFENENVNIRVFHARDSQRVQCSNKSAEVSNTAHNVRRRTWQDYTYHRPAMGFHR
jgi:hypothetical protein